VEADVSEGTRSAAQAGVRSEQRGQIRVLTLDRPDVLNAADLAMQRRLLECWQELEHAHDVRAVVVTGSGRAFCAGGDRSLFAEITAGTSVKVELGVIHRALLRVVLGLPIPIVAAVNGPAVGFGAELVALCDLVVMSSDAFLSDPHVRQGFAPSPGCQLVWPHLLPLTVAKELALTGRRVDAAEARALGLANQVVDPGRALSTALGVAADLASLPPDAVAAAKRGFHASLLDELTHLEGLATW
jgi:enoyl-CoA hydratase